MSLDGAGRKAEKDSQNGLVDEIQINVFKLAVSSSARALYLVSPVSFLVFFAKRVRIMDPRVSFMNIQMPKQRRPAAL